jgi:translation elongation factor EF-G
VRVFDGVIEVGRSVKFASKGVAYVVSECGIMYPNRMPVKRLRAGMVGYVTCGVRQTREARVGDTLIDADAPASLALKGFVQPQPMLFAGIFPEDPESFDSLKDAVERLTLNDASVRAISCTSAALGPGYRCGFLGALHFEVFCERLEAEYAVRVVTTRPSVPFMVRTTDVTDGSTSDVIYDAPADFPPFLHRKELLEPMCIATVVCPSDMQGPVRTLLADSRGSPLDVSIIGSGTSATSNVRLRYSLPLAAVVSEGLPAKLKAATRGFASLDYEHDGYKPADSGAPRHSGAPRAGGRVRVRDRALAGAQRRRGDVPQAEGAAAATTVCGGAAGGDWQQGDCAREHQRRAQECDVAHSRRRRLFAQGEAARQAKGGQEADEIDWRRHNRSRGVPHNFAQEQSKLNDD